MGDRFFSIKRGAAAASILLLVLATVWFLRAPVVIVTDAPFETLYGSHRALFRRVSTSMYLFRAVRPALINPDAAPDAAVAAVVAVSNAPFAVLFPHRYRSHALAYAERYSGIPSAVVGGPPVTPQEAPIFTKSPESREFPRVLSADLVSDLYAAGRAAADLGSARMGLPTLVGEGLREDHIASFTRGLVDGGEKRAPIIIESAAALSRETASCIVLLPGARGVDYLPPDLPLILFSWVDPRYVPPGTALIFDDSIYGVLEGAVLGAVKGPERVALASLHRRLSGERDFLSFFTLGRNK